ncbi:MAG: asparagine synthase-related protein [Gemmatimonadota bacterium]|nr:asparagine synthase-related protein [Gemmatimonadota bacterium]
MSTQRVDIGQTSILWSASPRAPVGTDVTARHVAVVWGDAILAGPAGRATANDVATSWSVEPESPAVYDGYYAAAVITRDGCVAVGADVLGYFPVYYTEVGDVLLAGASPEPFRHHPAFREAISLEGLFTVLMFGGPFQGPCLLERVRRLRMGRLLRWRPREAAREIMHFELPTKHHDDASFDDHLDAVHAAHVQTARRHHPAGESYGLHLSGGLDSRFVAAYLHAQGADIRALTFGRGSDYEAECARAVARQLKFSHTLSEIGFEHYLDFAARCVRWEHLGCGMATMHMWGAIDPSRNLPNRSGNGYNRSREQPLFPTEFHALRKVLTQRAIPAETLRSLARGPEAHDIIDGLVERHESAYNALNDSPPERAWRLFTETYVRHYAASVPWRLSFGSWPVMWELDREFLDAWIGVPIAAMANRVLVETLLTRRFPRLARLPLDRNAHSRRPIAPSLAYRAREWLSFHAPRWVREARKAREGGASATAGERRHFYRHYDFDNPGWRSVREAAEPYRSLLADQFEMQAVNLVLPPPNALGSMPNPMTDGFAAKMLLGLIFWMRQHSGR